MGKRTTMDRFREAVDAAKAQRDGGPLVLRDAILCALGLDLDVADLQEVAEDLGREGIVPGQLAALPPWHVDALDDVFGWSHRFDSE